MNHPAADQARAAIAAQRYTEAERLLESALSHSPDDPDLLCEKAILSCYRADEGSALPLIGKTHGAVREAFFHRILGQHAYCLSLAGDSEPELVNLARKLSQQDATLTEGIGVKITACLIVKNEAELLRNCLQSIRDVVSEIVVVDTGSTDATIDIAESFGAIVDSFAWCDDFSAARNHALRLATSPWILWIDADEELTRTSKKAIRRAVVRPHFGGYEIEIVNPTDDREGGSTFTHSAVRLFRRMPNVRFEGRIHEQVCPSLELLGLPWARLTGATILHHGYRPQVMESRNKHERTISLLEREVRESPNDPFQWFNLSMAHIVANRYAEAENASRRSVRLMPDGAIYAVLAYQNLIQAQTALGKLDAALESAVEADSRGYGGLVIEFERAGVLMKAGRPEEALSAIDRCLTLSWPEGVSGDRGIETHKRNVLRGQILAVLGRYQEALAEFEHALRIDPGFAPCHFSCGLTLEKMDRRQEALSYYHSAFDDPETRSLALKGTGRLLGAEGKHEESATAFKEAWLSDPNDYEAWIGWAGACEAWGNYAAIVEAYESFAKGNEPTVDMLINWGRALEMNGDPEKALHCFTEAIKREPSQANAYFNCGDMLYRLGMYHDAAHIYEAGLRINPVNADGWFTLANCLAQVGLGDAAARMYEQALVIDPQHDKARHNLGVVSEPAMV